MERGVVGSEKLRRDRGQAAVIKHSRRYNPVLFTVPDNVMGSEVLKSDELWVKALFLNAGLPDRPNISNAR